MELFEYKDEKLDLHPAVYGLEPFKKIKGKNKLQEFLFLYFYADYKSDFADIINLDERKHEIKKVIKLPETWDISPELQEAIDFYIERQRTPSMHLLEASLEVVEKLKKYYKTIDLDERDKNGKPIHNVSAIQKAASEVSLINESIRKQREAIKRELEEAARIRGGGDIGMFEDPADDDIQ